MGRWLAALSTTCDGVPLRLLRTLAVLGINRTIVNFRDGLDCAHARFPSNVRTVRVPGMKARFWLDALGDVSGFQYVWLIDEDVSPHAPPLTLAYLEQWCAHANCGVLQPSVISRSKTGRASDHDVLNAARFSDDCAAQCACVEQMSPIFRASLWSEFHHDVLSRIPHSLLDATDWGLMTAWTGLAHTKNLNSLVLRDTFVLHHDARTYDSLLGSTTKLNKSLREKHGNPLKAYLYTQFRHLVQSATCHHRRRCFARPDGGDQISSFVA